MARVVLALAGVLLAGAVDTCFTVYTPDGEFAIRNGFEEGGRYSAPERANQEA